MFSSASSHKHFVFLIILMRLKEAFNENLPISFHIIHINRVGLFEKSAKRNKYLVVIIDAFKKFTVLKPIKSQETQYTVKDLLSLVYLFEVPIQIISNREMNMVVSPRANGQANATIRSWTYLLLLL